MAGYMKKAMSYLGMTDVVDDDEIDLQDDEDVTSSDFDAESTVTPIVQHDSSSSQQGSTAMSSSIKPFPAGPVNRITTLHPKTYEEAKKVGRAIRDGVPVVLNLTGVAEAVAYRILDFSAGVVFGVHGSLERVTPRVFLLSPARVNIKVDQAPSSGSEEELF